MERRSLIKMMGAATAAASTSLIAGKASAADKVSIALIPGLTADGFYVAMHHGAEAAAKAVGVKTFIRVRRYGTPPCRFQFSMPSLPKNPMPF